MLTKKINPSINAKFAWQTILFHRGGRRGLFGKHLTDQILGNSIPPTQSEKNARGARKFTPEDVALLKQIHHLVKEKGFTLDGAKTQLKKEKKHSH